MLTILQYSMDPQYTMDSSEILQQLLGINCTFCYDILITVTCPKTSVVAKNEATLMLARMGAYLLKNYLDQIVIGIGNN